ncbi:177_t:CDS:2 [Funneliformis caledonium]|uniref:177_t:CDS:1 n=1 Tax=Funneliformis caledonium TaxID=1117310 RepID=A0A9N9B8J8_9GLOM|nr:177_t:CDS:2 [Funneliformis caledonium]
MSTSKQNKPSKNKFNTSIIKGLDPQQNNEFQQDEKSRETDENVIVVFSGKGPAINKAITVVEIIKRKLDGSLHQYTQIGRNFLTHEDREKDKDYEMILDNEDDGQVQTTVDICSYKKAILIYMIYN